MDSREKIRLSVTFPADLHRALGELAKEHERSLAGEVVYALRQYVKAQGKEKQR